MNKPPKSILREDRVSQTTESWRAWAESCEVEEWVNGVSGVLENGWNEGYVCQYLLDPTQKLLLYTTPLSFVTVPPTPVRQNTTNSQVASIHSSGQRDSSQAKSISTNPTFRFVSSSYIKPIAASLLRRPDIHPPILLPSTTQTSSDPIHSPP